MKTLPAFLLMILAAGFLFAAEPQTQTQTQTQAASTPQVFRHATGLEFQYPGDWITRDVAFAETELVPSDQQKNEKGITEGFFLFGIGGNFTTATDSTLAGYVNTLIVQIAPFLKQDGSPEAQQHSAGPAMKISWSGASNEGKAVTSRAFVILHGKFAFALVMLGNEDRMTLREPKVRDIFSSFRFTESAKDAALEAMWKTPAAAAAQTQPQAQTQSAVPGLMIEIKQDGSFIFQDPSAPGGGTEKGEWFSRDGRLCFVFPESFFLDFTYEIHGKPGSRKLTLNHASGGFQELLETPPSGK